MAEAAPAIAVMASGSRSPLHCSPRSRRYSSDDIGCRYSSLSHTHLMPPLVVSHLGSSEGSLPRRQSVAATSQTEERYRSPRQLPHRRRSEFSAHEKRRRSRAELDNLRDAGGYRDAEALNGGRRGTRSSQMLNAYDLDSARLSVSSGRHRKTSRHSTPPREVDPEERRRSRVVLVCASVAVAIFLIAILLVAVTLRLSPTIDEMGEYQYLLLFQSSPTRGVEVGAAPLTEHRYSTHTHPIITRQHLEAHIYMASIYTHTVPRPWMLQCRSREETETITKPCINFAVRYSEGDGGSLAVRRNTPTHLGRRSALNKRGDNHRSITMHEAASGPEDENEQH